MAENEKDTTIANATVETQNAAPAPRKSKKGRIALVIIAVIVALGAGFWAWHNTPGFCGTVCHDTMGEHVDNFYNGPGQAKVHADANLGCLDCHAAELETQIKEAQAQLSGTYGDLSLTSRYYVANDTCLNCHGGSYDNLAKSTNYLGDYNPHQSPHGQMNCNECHKGHAAQVDLCGECHVNGGQEMKA